MTKQNCVRINCISVVVCMLLFCLEGARACKGLECGIEQSLAMPCSIDTGDWCNEIEQVARPSSTQNLTDENTNATNVFMEMEGAAETPTEKANVLELTIGFEDANMAPMWGDNVKEMVIESITLNEVPFISEDDEEDIFLTQAEDSNPSHYYGYFRSLPLKKPFKSVFRQEHEENGYGFNGRADDWLDSNKHYNEIKRKEYKPTKIGYKPHEHQIPEIRKSNQSKHKEQ